MSNNLSDVHSVRPSGRCIHARVSSYMAGRWGGYGYLAVLQIEDEDRFAAHGLAGQIRNIPGVQRVVWKSDKIHMGGPTEQRLRHSMDTYVTHQGVSA